MHNIVNVQVTLAGHTGKIGDISVISKDPDVIVLWQELVKGPEVISGEWSQRIFLNAERISANGSITWQTIPLIISEDVEDYCKIAIHNNYDGILLAWYTGLQEQGNRIISAQKIDSNNGEFLWGSIQSGIFGVVSRYKGVPEIVNDGLGGVIIIAVVGDGDMLYAQRLDSAGNILWGDGIRIE